MSIIVYLVGSEVRASHGIDFSDEAREEFLAGFSYEEYHWYYDNCSQYLSMQWLYLQPGNVWPKLRNLFTSLSTLEELYFAPPEYVDWDDTVPDVEMVGQVARQTLIELGYNYNYEKDEQHQLFWHILGAVSMTGSNSRLKKLVACNMSFQGWTPRRLIS